MIFTLFYKFSSLQMKKSLIMISNRFIFVEEGYEKWGQNGCRSKIQMFPHAVMRH